MARAGRNVSTQACHAAPAVGGLASSRKKTATPSLSSVFCPRHSSPLSPRPSSLFIFTHHPTPERESDISPFTGITLGIAAQLTRLRTHHRHFLSVCQARLGWSTPYHAPPKAWARALLSASPLRPISLPSPHSSVPPYDRQTTPISGSSSECREHNFRRRRRRPTSKARTGPRWPPCNWPSSCPHQL